jgi:hypothetical protein
VKTWDFLVGIVVFRGINTVITPPAVSIPRESGATSNKTISFVYWFPVPVRIAA